MSTVARPNKTRWRRGALAACVVAMSLPLACDDSDDGGAGGAGGSSGDTVQRRAFLASLGPSVIRPELGRFVAASQALEQATAALAAAPTDDGARTDARAAFGQAMEVWQRLELMQVGPAGLAGKVIGGQSLRDEIYSWPITSPCRVDQVLVAEGYAADHFIEDSLVNAYGLDALEYLLFVEGPDNACAAPVRINADGSWAALGAETVTTRRAAYAARLGRHLSQVSAELERAWAPEGGDFGRLLGEAGQPGSPYPSVQAALDEVFAGIFYLDRQVKDEKLGVPTGLDDGCDEATCPDALESPFALRARENLMANLKGFEAVFLGQVDGAPEQVGFDDLLVEAGAPELAERMARKVTDAHTLMAGLQSFDGLLVSDPDAVRGGHAAVKTLTDDLKSQFVTVLNLSVPQEGASDND